jgi:mono/diheme cytochrome c family protein
MLEHRDRGSRAAFTPLSESRARSTRVPRVATGHLVSLAIAALLGLAFATACGKPRELTAADRGEVIYRTNCISCHNSDPNLPGPLGPAIAGSSRALIEARVLHGTYPPGYHPQRHSHTMRALPWLDGHIDDLTAYLAAAAHPAG